ncbi:MAG: hypothetical protein ACRC6X_01530 [Culicoidibacterales bacterium]
MLAVKDKYEKMKAFDSDGVPCYLCWKNEELSVDNQKGLSKDLFEAKVYFYSTKMRTLSELLKMKKMKAVMECNFGGEMSYSIEITKKNMKILGLFLGHDFFRKSDQNNNVQYRQDGFFYLLLLNGENHMLGIKQFGENYHFLAKRKFYISGEEKKSNKKHMYRLGTKRKLLLLLEMQERRRFYCWMLLLFLLTVIYTFAKAQRIVYLLY